MQRSVNPYTMTIKKIAPTEIEAESFRIIEKELGPTDFDERAFPVVRRIIHATGDFAFAENIRIHPRAIEAGVAAIQAGKNIYVDVNMAAAGISRQLMKKWGGRVICRVAAPETVELARMQGLTRSEAALSLATNDNIGIVAVGNAPTALLKAMQLIEQGLLNPDLVIGVPVGFVNAVESKEILVNQEYPFITALGRRGGTPVAVAAINALLRLA